MYNECDFIAKQHCVEERLAEAARERRLHQAGHARGSLDARIRAAYLLRVGRLLVHAGQWLETLASAYTARS